MIGFESISVTSPYRIKVVQDIQMEWKPNEHGRLFIRGLLDEQEQVNAVLKASTDDEVQVYDGETKIFSGLIANVQTKHYNGIYSIELEAISGTSRLDAQKRRRSFQNKNMTYGELVKSVLKAYAGYDVIQLVGENEPIGEPIIQYDETDWEFLKRMASHLQSVVFSDIYEAKPRMYIGVPNRNSIQLPDDLPYTASKDLLAYQEARSGAASVHHTDFFTYEIQSGTRYAIGDEVLFRDKPMVISEMKAAMDQGQLIYNYRLSRRDGIRQNRIHNSKLVGVSMNGKVLDVKGQQVKLHLEIDQEQSPASAYWFPFAPPTGSVMYSMPQKGTNASLYFPDDAGSKAKVIGCVRTNGEDCSKTGDPNNRYFGTEHGSELEITPTAINVVSGSKEPLMISFDDAAGVILTSHRKLTMNAGEDISLYTPKRVVFRTPNMILAKKLSKLSGFTVESEYHLLGSQVKLDGADRTSYPKYNDEIETYTPKEEEEKKFSWGKLFKNVVAGLAVVAAVTAVAVLCVATLGAGAVVIGAVAAGAAIAGTAAVASMAVSDIVKGEVSDMGDYMQAAFRESVIGAVSGAVFGPFGTMATIGGKMAFGATTNTFESIMRQSMEGNGFSFTTLLMDAGIGGITGGLFDARVLKAIGNAGKKGFQKSSELVQKAVGASTAWLKQGVKSVEEGFKESLKDLAAAGSQFAQMFAVRQPALANGIPSPNVSFFEKWMPDKVPQRTEVQINYDKVMKELEEEAAKKIAKAVEIPPAFKQTEFASSYEARLNQTPALDNKKVGFEGIRGESICTLKPPPDPELKKILDEFGIDGIQYKNAVPDLSPVAKAQLEIDYMLGGKGKYGSKARAYNFVQADQKLADQLNNSPELARQFGMEPGGITSRDIEKYRDKNKLTWHELNDVTTIQLVPTKINSTFGHLGGVGEINAGAFEPGGFAQK